MTKLKCEKCGEEFKEEYLDEAVNHSQEKNHYTFNILGTNLNLAICGKDNIKQTEEYF